jgi:hypothetical protein
VAGARRVPLQHQVNNEHDRRGQRLQTKVATNNTYNVKRVSYNGGSAGVRAAPTPDEEKVRHEKHVDATPNQVEHERTAMKTPTQKASVNHGAPQVAATPEPAAFDAPETMKASNKAVAAKTDAPAAARTHRRGRDAPVSTPCRREGAADRAASSKQSKISTPGPRRQAP